MEIPNISPATSSSLWVGIAPKVPSRKALNEIRGQWRTGRPGVITDTSTLGQKAWKKQLQSSQSNNDLNNSFTMNENIVGKRYKDFHPSLPLNIDGEWSGHTFASFSHRFYLTTHMSQTTSKAIVSKSNEKKK